MSETNGTYFKYLNQIFKEFQRFGSSFDLYENQQPFIGTAPNTNEININENNFFNKHNHLLLFLNTTRSGSAHRHFGITFKQFIGTIFLSFLFSGSQIILFSFLRTKFKTLYQPNLFLKKLKETLNKKKREKRNNKSSTIETTTTTTTTTTSSTTPNTINNSSNFSANSTKKKKKNEQVSDNNIYNMIISEDVNHGLFNWLKKSIFDVNHQDYFLLGLDAYLFIRFITMLSFFCFILTIVIVPILIPIHYNSGFNKKKTVTKLLNEQLGISNKTFITKNLLNNTHIHEEFIINYNGLDKISMSNIAPIYSNRLIYHFLLAVFTVLLFHFFLIHELNFYCKSKANFSKMLEENKNVNFFKELWDSRATLFVDNVPSSMLKNMELLIYFFEKFCPCSVTDIWFIPKNYERFFKFKKRHIKILNKIEKIEMELLLNNYFLLNFNEDLKPLLLSSLSGNSSSYNNDNGNSTSNYLISQYKNNLLLENTVSYEHLRFIKNAKIHTFMNFFKMNNLVEVEFKKITFKLKFLKTPLQITLYKPIVNYRYKTYSKNKNTLLDNCVYSYIENLQKWGNFKEIILDKSQPAKPNKGKNKCKVPLVANYNYDFKSFHKKAFIKFKSIYMADIYHQLLLSDHINLLNNKIVGTNLKDIIWDNLTCSSSTLLFIRNLIGNLCTFAVIIGWVVPVAFVGLTSQIPYLTKLVPFLSIINTFPPLITELLENIIPVLTLMFLTEIVPDIFR
ncbi:Spo75p SCDLUD_004841 [Saccharomycodes ludwigii]|uniref:Spo75p n=1 Tax=Saccharomycodes ludwigii TaxID=36035 RepID=UPI001E8C7072|nr:hypothetical protein SCDLUD_004841 [Saccharomycodes ludwigii]KAH3899398.1 hypothetical protein SCDLUD_004841 [Saccharomycodes ludwigii]